MKYLFSLVAFCLLCTVVFAQGTYSMSGTVTDTTGARIQSATVFIASTEKMTSTNADGIFTFTGLKSGNYLVVVNMLGYESVKQAVTINDHDETLHLMIHDKKNILKEVVVGAKKQSPKDLKKFTEFFLGHSYDPEQCKILNPELINFGHTDTTLTATSDDFLIIENKILGYRVKYLLKSFYCRSNGFHFFDGDYSFEPLTGTAEQQRLWDRNRKVAYQGSSMHFLRSLYAGTTRKEGFLVYRSTTDKALILEPNPSDPQQFVTRSDSSTISVNIMPMVLIVHDKEKAAKPDVISNKKPKKYTFGFGLPARFTLYKLVAKIDSRGSIANFTFVYDFGYWGIFGVANQLPFEYSPD